MPVYFTAADIPTFDSAAPADPLQHGTLLAVAGSFATSTGNTSQNVAYYTPLMIHTPVTVYRMWNLIAAASGNIQMGIYDENANLVVASTAAAAVAGINFHSLTPTVLTRGVWYMAFVSNTSAGTWVRWSLNSLRAGIAGTVQQSSAYPLPSTATFAATTLTSFPAGGIICRSYL